MAFHTYQDKFVGRLHQHHHFADDIAPFFGHDAMTASATAELALKYDLPIYMAQVVRRHGAHFTVTMHPPLQFTRTGDKHTDVMTIMKAINQIFEAWVREHPAQWFWVHRRWPKDLTTELLKVRP